jgi:hypothetical protein
MTMQSAQWALQKAIYGRLSSSLAGTPVYDYVPEGTAYPYVVVGDCTEVEYASKTWDGVETTCTVHGWSDYHGRFGAADLVNDAVAAIMGTTLDLSGDSMTCITQRYEFGTVLEDSTEAGTALYHGVARMRFRVYWT